MRALWSGRQICSHNVSQKVKRIRHLSDMCSLVEKKKRGFFDRKLLFPAFVEMGVFGPRNPLFQEMGIRAAVWDRGNPKPRRQKYAFREYDPVGVCLIKSKRHTGNIAKRRLLVNPYGTEIQTEFCYFSFGE